MSRIGKQLITIPEKTTVTVTKDGVVTVSGPLGELSREFKAEVAINIGENEITLVPKDASVFTRSLWGTYASHLSNMVHGVHTPFEKKLVVEGVGFRAECTSDVLTLNLGFSHPVVIPIPKGVVVGVERNVITIAGSNKEDVGAFAAHVRAVKKPEPYKGKGIRYENEVIKRKQGKKTA
jgi:large subunit ribosomal protein L6